MSARQGTAGMQGIPLQRVPWNLFGEHPVGDWRATMGQYLGTWEAGRRNGMWG